MSSTHTTTRTNDGLITLSPKNEASQSALVIICHGLGDSAEGFVDVAEQLAMIMPYCKFVLPTAPSRPVTMNAGMSMPAWYDIAGLDERSNEECDGLVESRDTVRSLLEQAHDEGNGVPYSRMVLMGFSQGGALSLFTGLSLARPEHKLAGIVCLSGYLAGRSQFTLTDGLASTPVFHGHGRSDPMVQFTMAERTKDILTSADYALSDYTLKGYAGLPHSVNQEELADVVSFLRKVLPDDPTCRVRNVKAPEDMSVKELKAAIRHAGIAHKAVGFMEKSEFVKLLKDYRDNN
jgi:lysophospholipase-2